jgi:hypothetical protein
MNAASRKKYEAELVRLDDEFRSLQEHWARVPRFAWFALLAPLAWVLQGFSGALIVVLVTPALVGTRAYLIGMRKTENRWTRDSVARELSAR